MFSRVCYDMIFIPHGTASQLQALDVSINHLEKNLRQVVLKVWSLAIASAPHRHS